MNHVRTLAAAMAIAACALVSFGTSAQAQIVSTQRAGQGLPQGQVLAPSNPGGMFLVGPDIYIGDFKAGLRQFVPVPSDTPNPDPVNTGILVYDDNQNDNSSPCVALCQTGQVIFDGSTNVYIPLNSQKTPGEPAPQPKAGIVHTIVRGLPSPSVLSLGTFIAPNAGLEGSLPTALALGPDGQLYVGFLKNGNIVRISNPQLVGPTAGTQVVQSVGGTPNGRPVRALVFVGNDLYIASSDSLSVIKNATAATCKGGCNAVPVADGLSGFEHVGLATDGINRVYVAVNGRGVFRYSIASNTTSVVSTSGLNQLTQAPVSYSFVAGRSNLLYLDRLGNLWIGDDTSGGTTANAGRLWYISAAQLGVLPAAP
jgi:hypothetical protein